METVTTLDTALHYCSISIHDIVHKYYINGRRVKEGEYRRIKSDLDNDPSWKCSSCVVESGMKNCCNGYKEQFKCTYVK